MSKNSMYFIGLDLGDRLSHLILLDPKGELVEESRIPTAQAALQRGFSMLPPSLHHSTRLHVPTKCLPKGRLPRILDSATQAKSYLASV